MDAPGEASSKPPCDREDALAVLKRLREAGHVAYFAGGCVRDSLLGLNPKDYDVATDAPPTRVRELFSSTQAVGAAFGVVLVRHRRSTVEVATFRAEGEYHDGRHPSSVRFTSAEEDAKRRDFTINGLFLDPLTDQVIDFVGGREDLRSRKLRAIGEPADRFREDHLRLLRAVRFAARFELEIEPRTAEAMLQSARQLKGISPERIAEELRLMLTGATRAGAWELLWRFGLIHEIFRFLPLKSETKLDPLRSVFLSLVPGAPVSFGLSLAAGMLDARLQEQPSPQDVRLWLAKPAVQKAERALRQALRYSNEEADEMSDALLGVGMLLADLSPSVAGLKRFLARPAATASRRLLDALSAVGVGVERAAALRPRLAELETTNFHPDPLITGDDLSAAGLQPGPMFKTVLDQVYDAQLEDRISTKDQAMEMALRIAGGVQ